MVNRTVASDVEKYSSSVAGIEIDAVRTGRPVSSSSVLAVTGGRFAFTESKIGFPMLSRTTIPDDMVVVAYIVATTPGSRWCHIALEPGQVIVYSPGAEHAARNLPGLDFMFAMCDVDQLEIHAQDIGTNIEVPSRGQVHLLADTAATGFVGPAFERFADLAASDADPLSQPGDDALRAMVHALSEEDRVRRIGCSNRVDSRHVVLESIDFAESIGRIPSISELCVIAHVSQRRLRQAFNDEYEMPPSRFFRAWALGQARQRLARSDATAETVTRIASGLGFDHLGRFSGHYKEIFDEHPSDTLRAEV